MMLRLAKPRMASLVTLSAGTLISLWLVRPPATVSETAPESEFSSARAMKHLRMMCQAPHPVGSDENARVRDYLVQQLVTLVPDVQLQKAPSVNVWNNQQVTLQNIVARIKGTDGQRAIMLLCHYDSVVGGP